MKKFWKTIEIKKVSSKEFYILLDNKKLKTPLKNELILSNHLMANEILKEWNQNSDIINTEHLIFYGLLSTAIDKIHGQRDAYISDIENLAQFIISRSGDLIHKMYIKVDRNRIQSRKVNNPGASMIKEVSIEIGGQLIDRHFGEWLEIFAELTEYNPSGHIADSISPGTLFQKMSN